MFPSEEAAAWYLAAMFDAEGSVTMRKHVGKTHGYSRDARITNTDHEILDTCKQALDLLGIRYRFYSRKDNKGRLGSKQIHDIVISHKDGLEVLAEKVPLQLSRKREKLKEALGTYVRKNKPDMKTLHELFASGASNAKIAEGYGVTPGAVYFWKKEWHEWMATQLPGR